MDFDVIIVGGGAAGLSAGLWCDELGLNASLLESGEAFGGQLLLTHNAIENYLGKNAKNGRDLLKTFLKQTENRHFTRCLRAEVGNLDVHKKLVKLNDGRMFSARAVIIASGIRRRKLGVEGEVEFQNKGILSSGNLDKNTVSGKTVVVVGGGDAAIENALILSDVASKVHVVHRRNELRARREFTDMLGKKNNVEVHYQTIVNKIAGNKGIEFVEAKNVKTNETLRLQANAVIVRIGVQPNSKFVSGDLGLDENGYIKVNDVCQTSVEGVYAVGDVSNPYAPTVSSAVGSGATAVKHINSWLNA